MDRLIFFLCLLFAVSAGKAQTGGFLYLQSESNLPFEAAYKAQTFHSSATGYLVIPQLPTGMQTVTVDFGTAIAPPHIFHLTIEDKPLGYSIRQSVTNELLLFDLVSNTVLKGDAVLLQQVVKEPELLLLPRAEVAKQTVAATGEKQVPALSAANKPDKQKKQAPAIVVAKQVMHWQNPVSGIQKIFDREGADGIDQVYVLAGKNHSDTIALFLPILQEPRPRQMAMNRPAGSIGMRTLHPAH